MDYTQYRCSTCAHWIWKELTSEPILVAKCVSHNMDTEWHRKCKRYKGMFK